MIGFTLLATTITLGLLTVMCAVAVRPAELQSVTDDPYGTPNLADPSADTMTTRRCEITLAGDWHEVELTRLCDVEDFLDALEVRNVRQREMAIVDNDRFVVRWR